MVKFWIGHQGPFELDGDSFTISPLSTPAPAPEPAAPAPIPAPMVWVLTWPSQTLAPVPMVVGGGTYAFAFTPNTDPQGHSISLAEFDSPPRMRSWCLATDPAGEHKVPNGDGLGISGIVILGSDAGQCVVQPGVTYYLVVTNSVGTPGDDATGVVTLR